MRKHTQQMDTEWLEDYIHDVSYKSLFGDRDELEVDELEAKELADKLADKLANKLADELADEPAENRKQADSGDCMEIQTPPLDRPEERSTQTDTVSAQEVDMRSILAAVTRLNDRVERVHLVVNVLSWFLLANMLMIFRNMGT